MIWLYFNKHFKLEYARILKQGVDNTIAHIGYRLAYNANKEDDTMTIVSITEGLTINGH